MVCYKRATTIASKLKTQNFPAAAAGDLQINRLRPTGLRLAAPLMKTLLLRAGGMGPPRFGAIRDWRRRLKHKLLKRCLSVPKLVQFFFRYPSVRSAAR